MSGTELQGLAPFLTTGRSLGGITAASFTIYAKTDCSGASLSTKPHMHVHVRDAVMPRFLQPVPPSTDFYKECYSSNTAQRLQQMKLLPGGHNHFEQAVSTSKLALQFKHMKLLLPPIMWAFSSTWIDWGSLISTKDRRRSEVGKRGQA